MNQKVYLLSSIAPKLYLDSLVEKVEQGIKTALVVGVDARRIW